MKLETRGEPNRTPNRLSWEKSPYLLQHQFNPVDWYAWGEPAFAAARESARPIFLSIGYSTCHWCHVMERETFENQTVADFLNQHFISIKVDREERPDVDKIYMTFVQATTGQGGWPLTVFLTPNLKPFFGGTYFPPTSQHGRPGFRQLLGQIQELWRSRHADIIDSADEIHSRLAQAASSSQQPAARELSPETLKRAGLALKERYDPRHGGFGGAPKFPQPSHPQFLLRYALRFQDDEARRMVLHTCDRMADGGIHDQLGGGFSRYSVDAEWLVPHFEKMLYDNAQLAQLYLDAFLVSGEARHADVARDILDYVLRDMTHPQGGFYSAEDADSEGHEGKFYCWTTEELSKLLGPREFEVAREYFGVTDQGNFVDHSHPQPLAGQNVLSVASPQAGQNAPDLLAAAKAKMLARRAARIRPHLDDKILASWNGLMLGAMARASVLLNEPRYLQAAEKNFAFLKANLWDGSTKTLYHRWREGQRDDVQLLDAYAFLLWGVLDLYEATLQTNYLEFALDLGEAILGRFYDSERGGFWQAAPGTTDLILKIKEEYDGAEPSGNSVSCAGLLKLGHIAGHKPFLEAAQRTLRLFSAQLEQVPQAMPFLLQALDFSLQEPIRAVLAGDPTQTSSRLLLTGIHSVFQPNKVVLGTKGPVDSFSRTLPDRGDAVVYLCHGTSCQAPTSDPEVLKKLLQQA